MNTFVEDTMIRHDEAARQVKALIGTYVRKFERMNEHERDDLCRQIADARAEVETWARVLELSVGADVEMAVA